jgi:hypothetical protein
MEASGLRHASAALPPGEKPPVSIGFVAAWIPDPVWTLCQKKKYLLRL